MEVVRAPLRVSLFGGGTDYPHHYEAHGMTVISFALTRCIYVTWNPRPTGGCRVSYSQVEELERLADAEHTLVRAVAQQYSIEEPCTLTIVSDIPKGTGLGSSSALAVALCRLAGACERSRVNVATTAFELERGVSEHVGCQDHLPAAFGGFAVYRVEPGWERGRVSCTFLPTHCVAMVEQYGLLLYTGESRESGPQMARWKGDKNLAGIQALAERMAGCVDRWSPRSLAEALDSTWQAKRQVGGVSDPRFDAQYHAALDAGAWGGKLCGAGGGGCWFFLVPPERREKVVDALGLVEIPFGVSREGVQRWTL